GRGGLSVILVDANVLLNAEDSLCEQHEAARNWWDERLSGGGSHLLELAGVAGIYPHWHQPAPPATSAHAERGVRAGAKLVRSTVRSVDSTHGESLDAFSADAQR